MAGAVLMEPAFADRIDTDLERMMVIDRAPTGDPLLDDVLERIAQGEEHNDTRGWIETLAVVTGPLVAVDVVPPVDADLGATGEQIQSRWTIVWNRINPWSKPTRTPGIVSVLPTCTSGHPWNSSGSWISASPTRRSKSATPTAWPS